MHFIGKFKYIIISVSDFAADNFDDSNLLILILKIFYQKNLNKLRFKI